MKAKTFRVIRPEAEITVSSFVGWLLLPCFLARVYFRCIRLFVVPLYGGSKECGKLRILSIPKLTVKRADAQ